MSAGDDVRGGRAELAAYIPAPWGRRNLTFSFSALEMKKHRQHLSPSVGVNKQRVIPVHVSVLLSYCLLVKGKKGV